MEKQSTPEELSAIAEALNQDLFWPKSKTSSAEVAM